MAVGLGALRRGGDIMTQEMQSAFDAPHAARAAGARTPVHGPTREAPDYGVLERTARGPLILLFYDGYEIKAEPGLLGGLHSQAYRAARFAWRTLRRKQVRTGFYTAFIGLVRCLREAGYDVRVNDFAAAARRPAYPIGLAGYPSAMDKVKLPNPVIFGPGDYGAPEPSRAVAADPRYRILIQPSDWFVEYYRPYCGDKMMTWFAPIDTRAWPDASAGPKTREVVIYDKLRWDREVMVPKLLRRVQAHLDRRGISHTTLRYGEHHQGEFAKAVAESRSLIFLCEHETQGLAYQEAMAAGTPVLAWDERTLGDPFLQQFEPPGLDVSSVPYFDDRCGMKFRIEEFETAFDSFWSRLPQFRPRDYVEDKLSYAEAARLYAAAYASLAEPG